MDIEIRSGEYITTNRSMTFGWSLYEVIHPLKIESVVDRWVAGDVEMLADWEISGQMVQLLPHEGEREFKSWSDGSIGFYQKIEQ